MKRLKRELRLWLYSVFMGFAIYILPKDCTRTAKWLQELDEEKASQFVADEILYPFFIN
jgi:hypothetical protein